MNSIKKPNRANLEKSIKELYKKILLRDPDRLGLDYYVSQMKIGKLTQSDIEKQLYDSEEAQSIRNFSHYSAKYWNDLERVGQYKNKLATDNENSTWIADIPNRFGDFLPFENVLIVGCGNGWLERELSDKNIGKKFDSFDISEEYIKEAESQKEDRLINYFIDDINNLEKIKPNSYDAVFNFAILHHATELDNAMKKLSDSLKPNGLIFNEEYIGPARNQYTDKHLNIMLGVMADLPEKFHSKYLLKQPLANFRVEPSEAIHSDLVIPIFKKYFDIVYERNMNGGIAYQILWNNIENFKDSADPESAKWLDYLLEQDFSHSKEKHVPILFWYGVGTTKKK